MERALLGRTDIEGLTGRLITGELNMLFEPCIHSRGTFLCKNIYGCVYRYKVLVADTVRCEESLVAANNVPDIQKKLLRETVEVSAGVLAIADAAR